MRAAQPEWRVSAGLTGYPEAVAAMEAHAARIADGSSGERVWLVEHPPLYTAGTSARGADLLMPDRFPVFATGRGGRHTYHGPGQRVVYVMLDLRRRGRDLRAYVAALEAWVIAVLGDFGVNGRVIAGKVGVWVETAQGTAKIAAIGVRVRQWVTFHGLALNVAPDLAHFTGIVPCGLPEPVTSLASLGIAADMAEVDAALHRHLRPMLESLERAVSAPADQ